MQVILPDEQIHQIQLLIADTQLKSKIAEVQSLCTIDLS